jgi:catechol 2,3-dioxygenase-like lactoylglutathione lyase family enzyme
VTGQADNAKFQSPHSVWAAKLIVDDLEQTRSFYEEMFDLKVVTHYDYAPDIYEEYIMAYESGTRLALFSPNPMVEKPLRKSAYPQVLIMVEAFEEITQRIKKQAIGFIF